jgi:6,7-dimethyl-8-ribityllumazine synthase
VERDWVIGTFVQPDRDGLAQRQSRFMGCPKVMPTFEGDYSPPAGRFAVVVARFNETVTRALLAGAIDGFVRHGVAEDRIDVAWVPGSFEIPLIARRMVETGSYAAVVCLGAVIRGETSHYDHVAGQAASGVMQASLATSVPVIFGILTTDTVEQALNRSGLKGGNKGAEAAMAAIEMVNLLGQIGNNVAYPTRFA